MSTTVKKKRRSYAERLREYEYRKQQLWNSGLSGREYERAVRQLVNELNI